MAVRNCSLLLAHLPSVSTSSFFNFFTKKANQKEKCAALVPLVLIRIFLEATVKTKEKKVSLPGSLRCCDPLLESSLTLSADSLHNSQSVLTSTDECEYCIHSVARSSLLGLLVDHFYLRIDLHIENHACLLLYINF